MRYFSAILTALVLALCAASASAQPKDPWANPPPSGSVVIPLATVPPHANTEKPDKDYSPAPRQTCAEELEEAKVENAYLKGKQEEMNGMYFVFGIAAVALTVGLVVSLLALFSHLQQAAKQAVAKKKAEKAKEPFGLNE